MAAVVQPARMRDQALEPAQLVVELRSRLRVAVGQVQAADDEPVRGHFQVAALRVLAVAGQGAAALDRLGVAREHGDAVPRALADPARAIARALDLLARKAFVGRLELLQAGDIGAFALEPLQQVRQPRADAVDVEGGDLEPSRARHG